MHKRLLPLCLLVVIALALGMVGCSSNKGAISDKQGRTAPAASPKPQVVDRTGFPVIVTYGDSLTAGLGVASQKSYPSQLQDELDRQGYKYRVVNAGISGDTTTGGLARVENVVKQKPAIVILELGANDGLRGQPVLAMKENLTKIIERLQQANTQVVLAGMQIPPNYGSDYTDSFQKVFADLAAKYKLTMIPFFLDGVAARPDLNQPDGIHPTADGYVLVVQNVMQTLQPMLRK